MKVPKNKDALPLYKDDVDFTSFSVSKKEISINGKLLPFRIGDRIAMTEHDKNPKTVMGVTIHEDGRCQYILEWHNPDTGAFQSEALTLTELKLMHSNINMKKKRNRVGFGPEDE